MDQYREETHKLNFLLIIMSSMTLYLKEKERILFTSTSPKLLTRLTIKSSLKKLKSTELEERLVDGLKSSSKIENLEW